tara:strand:+ start:1465 stop:1665 length:201 start_codon:yes stop_codon:yes gene_type:complete
MSEETKQNEMKIYGNHTFTYGGKAYLIGDEMEIKGVLCEITAISHTNGVSFKRLEKPNKKKLAVKH